MGPVAHIILQTALCSAALRATPQSQIAVRVHAVDRTSRLTFDQTFSVERGYDAKKVLQFDLPWTVYHLTVTAPKYRCGVEDFIVALPDTSRTIVENMSDGGAAKQTPPMMLVAGTAPESFLYAKPTYVLFAKSALQCDKPIGEPLPLKMDVEYDSDGYYASLYPDPSIVNVPTQLTMRVTTAASQYHYVRIPIDIARSWRGWPEMIQFNVSEDMIDVLAGKPVDTLLCLKIWQTSAG